MSKVKDMIKDQIRKRVSDKDIIEVVVKKSSDKELIVKYKECEAMLDDDTLSDAELEKLEAQLELLKDSLRRNNKAYIIDS